MVDDPSRELHARRETEFAEDLAHVRVDRSLRDREGGGDLPIRQTLRDEQRNFALPATQVGQIFIGLCVT